MSDKEVKEEPKIGTKNLNGLEVQICDDHALHYFSNFILTMCNDEEVILGFGNRKIKRMNEVEINSYFHLTIPHLKRLSKLLIQKIDELEKKVNNAK